MVSRNSWEIDNQPELMLHMFHRVPHRLIDPEVQRNVKRGINSFLTDDDTRSFVDIVDQDQTAQKLPSDF